MQGQKVSVEDQIQIEGNTLNLYDPASLTGYNGSVQIVEFNGTHNDDGATPQQWLLIETPEDGYIFYSLEGARTDLQGNGAAPDNKQEAHFIQQSDLPDFSQLKDVDYVSPTNSVPNQYNSTGFNIINDTDKVGSDITAPVEWTAGDDAIATGLNDDTVSAGSGNDLIWGGSGNDTIDGGYVGGFHEDVSINGPNAQIFRLYQGLLDRDPDQPGFEFWTGHLENGNVTLLQAITDFTSRSEYLAVFGGTNNADFVTRLYTDILDRVPDAPGYNFWKGVLDAGSVTRTEILEDFLEGQEFKDRTYGDFSDYMRDTNDTLTGTAGADVFIFGERFGEDVVTDFDIHQAGEKIDLSGLAAISSFNDLQSNHPWQSDNGAVIADTDGNLIILEGVQATDLTSDDFIF